jgi:hypothetical protein
MANTLEDCCDFSFKLKIDPSLLTSCSDCKAGGNTQWDGVFRDYFGTRCVYYVDDRTQDQFDGTDGLNPFFTRLRRSQSHECTWLLYIACSHCTLDDYIWVGSGPHHRPEGTYRMMHGCDDGTNITVETMEVLVEP